MIIEVIDVGRTPPWEEQIIKAFGGSVPHGTQPIYIRPSVDDGDSITYVSDEPITNDVLAKYLEEKEDWE